MFRMGLKESRECECGESIQSVYHVIMECRLNEVGRNRLRREIENIWMEEVKGDGNLQFDLNVILAPFSNESISESISERILKQSFIFLSSLSKVL